MNYPKFVKIVEVGARDGLQNEVNNISVATRVEFINRLSKTGLKSIEVGALVSPMWVPQMAHSAEVFQQIEHHTGVSYPMLIPNDRGLADALAIDVKEIAIFAAASETFSKKNINCTIQESLKRYEAVAQKAIAANVKVRGYVSCVVGCPYEGQVAIDNVVMVAQALLDIGCYEVSLGDTIGVGTPKSIHSMLSAIEQHIPIGRVGIHCHDTYGMAIANILMALQMGVTVIDSSVAGLGGCPYAPGASGNVATEDVLYLLEGLGINTGVNLRAIVEVSQFICAQLGIHCRSKAGTAFRAKF